MPAREPDRHGGGDDDGQRCDDVGPARAVGVRERAGDHEREPEERRSSTLMITVKARPRTRSGAPRWTSVMFATTAPPFPKPTSTIAATPTQTFGATAAQPSPTAKIARKRT